MALAKSAGKQIADGRVDVLRVQAVKTTPTLTRNLLQITTLRFQSSHQNSLCQSSYFPNTWLNIFREYTDQSIVKITELEKVVLRW